MVEVVKAAGDKDSYTTNDSQGSAEQLLGGANPKRADGERRPAPPSPTGQLTGTQITSYKIPTCSRKSHSTSPVSYYRAAREREGNRVLSVLETLNPQQIRRRMRQLSLAAAEL